MVRLMADVATGGTTDSRLESSESVVITAATFEGVSKRGGSTGGSPPDTRVPTETEWGSAARPCSDEQFGSVKGAKAVAGPLAPPAVYAKSDTAKPCSKKVNSGRSPFSTRS